MTRAAQDGPLLCLAGCLARGLVEELHLTPKPGLVDRLDAGSHPDLTLELMERSIELLRAAWNGMTQALCEGAGLDALVALGRAAEARMDRELGTNTHRGALFLGGLLLGARHRAGVDDEGPLREALAALAGERFGHPARTERSAPASSDAQGRPAPARALGEGTRSAVWPATHGAAARARHRVGGIVREALDGFPSLFQAALPAWRAERARGGDERRAAFAALAALMGTVEDTTSLHRCGAPGLARLRRDGAELARILEDGGAPEPFLTEMNDLYRELGLTMGGVADLLGLTLGWVAYRGA